MAGLIVHEWIENIGGSERVLKAVSDLHPKSEIYCLWRSEAVDFGNRRVRESWLSKTPFRKSKALALPLMPAVWNNISAAGDLDWMFVSSHAFAHHAHLKTLPDLPKYVYVHSPARYLWEPALDRRGNFLGHKMLSKPLRALDRRRAQHSGSLAANSGYIARRIERVWERESRVIFPPVDVSAIQEVSDWRERLDPDDEASIEALPASFILGASRFVSYKRLDLVIRAGELVDQPVVLAGAGPAEKELRDIAQRSSVPVYFIVRPSDALLYALYQSALLFVFPAVEDFGIMPVEAMALGTPTVVNIEGGASESVGALEGGRSLEFDSVTALREGVEAAADVDMRGAQRAANKIFGVSRFQAEIQRWFESRED